MNSPFRIPSPPPPTPPEPEEPKVSFFDSWKKHERYLAVIDVYEESLIECRTPGALKSLKARARDALILYAPVGDREPVRRAMAWLHKRTLADCMKLRDRANANRLRNVAPSYPMSPQTKLVTFGIVLMIGLIGLIYVVAVAWDRYH